MHSIKYEKRFIVNGALIFPGKLNKIKLLSVTDGQIDRQINFEIKHFSASIVYTTRR